jgi:UDP-N-acetylglucosamine--dolichyl-phosphate N-acetylglucosaminephosphotransferase
MAELLLFILFTLLAFVSILIVKKINFSNGIKGMDINKPGKPELPESTGIALLLPLFVGVVSLIWVQGLWELLPWFILVAIFSSVGFLDDIKHKFASKTVPWASRALPIALSSIVFSVLYSVQIVWIIPLALFTAGSASLQNTFAGLNGWEIGTGFIISLATVYILWTTPFRWIAIILSASILALLLWNKYPAKAFPGDSGTLLIGSSLAGLMVTLN